MVDRVVNALIAGVIGVAAFIAVKSMLDSAAIYGDGGNYTWGQATNPTVCTANSSNCTWYDATAADTMIHDILPIAIAIMIVAGLFMALTKVKGV